MGSLDEELYCWGPVFAQATAPDEILAGHILRNELRLLPTAIVSLAQQCDAFKTAREHARTVWKGLPRLRKIGLMKPLTEYYLKTHDEIYIGPRCFEKMLTDVFSDMGRMDYLLSSTRLKEWAGSSAKASSDEHIASVGIVTKDRVSALKACLASYVSQGNKWGRHNDYVVCDDSPLPETRAQYRDVICEIAKTSSNPIYYAGLEEKQAFARKLESYSIAPDLIAFALWGDPLMGPTYGANRNALMLHTAGDMIFSADDDTVCRVARVPAAKEGLNLGNPEVVIDFFANREAAWSSVEQREQDILAEHEVYLGKSLGTCVAERGDIPNFKIDREAASFLRLIREGQGRVVCSFNGLVGDSGSGDPSMSLFSGGRTRENMLRSEAAYRTAMGTREMVKSIDQASCSLPGICMTTFLGIDNRLLLPPFLPNGRMEDALFGEMIRLLIPDACFTTIPLLLEHAPAGSRPISKQKPGMAIDYHPYDALNLAFLNLNSSFRGGDAASNIKWISEYCKNLGTLPFKDFKELILTTRWQKRALEISKHHNILKQFPKSPKYWKADIADSLKQLEKSLFAPIPIAPVSLIKSVGLEQAEAQMQRYVFRFGELLEAWPKMVAAARDLRANGERLAQLLLEQ